MTILRIQEIYESRVKRLSNRAGFILVSLSLSSFEDFYEFFIHQNKKIDFGQIKNCGYKTELELIDLVKTIVGLCFNMQGETAEFEDPNDLFDARVEMLFNREFYKLSIRTRNVLSAFKTSEFKDFIKKFIQDNEISILSKLRNCGVKTTKEILEFKKKINELIDEVSISQESDVSEKRFLINRNIFSSEEDLIFVQKFDLLSNRTKNVLTELEASILNGFVKNILNNEDLYDLKSLHNCGKKTENEIQIFKNEVLEFLNNRKDEEVSRQLFKDIWLYIFEGNILRGPERQIFCNYFGYLKNENYETLDKIAEDAALTNERVRQISFIVLKKIKDLVCKIINKDKTYLSQYFDKEFFSITSKIVDEINKKEGTNFSDSFITYALHSVEESGYNFICTQKKPQNYSGFFYNKNLKFDFSNCENSFFNLIPIKKKHDLKFKIDELLALFTPEDLSEKKLSYEDKDNFLKALELLIKCKYGESTFFSITSEYVIFNRTAKKKICHYLIDILNDYKKPLHFSELYRECLKRGIEVSSPLNVHSFLNNYSSIFGLKGPGIYGLIEWGGYFGTIGDVTEKILNERNGPINTKELYDILSDELNISKRSINSVLFFYENENRFIKMKNYTIGLKDWLKNQ